MKKYRIVCPKHGKLLVVFSDKPICPTCRKEVDCIIPKFEMSNIKCSAKVSNFRGWASSPCPKTAKVERNGKWYCIKHDPEYIKRKKAERAAKAAPDMLAALQKLVRLLEPEKRSGNLRVSEETILNGARDAISKAEGKR